MNLLAYTHSIGFGRGKEVYLVLDFVPQTMYSVLYFDQPIFCPKVCFFLSSFFFLFIFVFPFSHNFFFLFFRKQVEFHLRIRLGMDLLYVLDYLSSKLNKLQCFDIRAPHVLVESNYRAKIRGSKSNCFVFFFT